MVFAGVFFLPQRANKKGLRCCLLGLDTSRLAKHRTPGCISATFPLSLFNKGTERVVGVALFIFGVVRL